MRPHEILADQGNCRDVGMDTMYPPEGDTALEAIAKSVCANCVVIDLCRQTASNHESGVWAGQTQKERSNFRRKVYRNNARARRNGSR